jgi:hypothetical protein
MLARTAMASASPAPSESTRISCHVERQNLLPVVPYDKEAIQNAKPERQHREGSPWLQLPRDDSGAMSARAWMDLEFSALAEAITTKLFPTDRSPAFITRRECAVLPRLDSQQLRKIKSRISWLTRFRPPRRRDDPDVASNRSRRTPRREPFPPGPEPSEDNPDNLCITESRRRGRLACRVSRC